jgi:hypothetical protein
MKKMSRKWILVLLVLAIATLGTFIPPIVSVWVMGNEKPLIILTGSELVALVSLVVSAYFGANVFQKHVVGDPNQKVSKTTQKQTIEKEKVEEIHIKPNENGEA